MGQDCYARVEAAIGPNWTIAHLDTGSARALVDMSPDRADRLKIVRRVRGRELCTKKKDATGSIDCEKSDDNITSTEVLIIGFGFSAIPLIRELERDGINYGVVSNGEGSIWDKLERHDRLDFDMVSSMHTSLYSFELVNRDAKDRYLPSKEYLSFIRKYLTQYSSRVIRDWVTSVENHSSHSIVRTKAAEFSKQNIWSSRRLSEDE